jgi:hypothetical protein
MKIYSYFCGAFFALFLSSLQADAQSELCTAIKLASKQPEIIDNTVSLAKELCSSLKDSRAEDYGPKYRQCVKNTFSSLQSVINACSDSSSTQSLPAPPTNPSTTTTKNENCGTQGDFPYISLDEITAGQPVMSHALLRGIAGDLRSPKGFFENDKTKSVEFCYDFGRSPFMKAFGVVQAPAGLKGVDGKPIKYILYDGHHTIGGILMALTNLKIAKDKLRKLSLPIKVNKQYVDLDHDEFWNAIQKDNLVYPDSSGKLPARHIIDVANDDIRDFLESTLVGCSETKAPDYKDKAPGHPLTLWLRVGGETKYKSINFTEFFMKEILDKNKFPFKSGTKITQFLVNRARAALRQDGSFLREKNILLVEPWGDGHVVLDPKRPGTKMTVEEYCKEIKDSVR